MSFQKLAQNVYGFCGLSSNGTRKCLFDFYNPFSTSFDFETIFDELALGRQHFCGITPTGILKCWGANEFGQLGDSKGTYEPEPVIIDSGTNYTKISAGSSSYYLQYSCGITSSGVLKCWGNNDSYQLGDGTTSSRFSPTHIDPSTTYNQISTGAAFSCGITTSGILKCWGANDFGQLGDGTNTPKPTPSAIDTGTTYSKVAANGNYACGISNSGNLKCWGIKQFGTSMSMNYFVPTQIDSGTQYSSVSASGFGLKNTTCAVTTLGQLKCWGDNSFGQIGDGTTTPRSAPIEIDSSSNYIAVAVGGGFVCGITSTKALKCWGLNNLGQLGDGTSADKITPTIVDPNTRYNQISAGYYRACGITEDDDLKCWGTNNAWSAQSSIVWHGCTPTRPPFAAEQSSSVPTLQDNGAKYSSVSVGDSHICGITMSGELKCWGKNCTGGIGNALQNSNIPWPVIP
jgi:alpha-tubulin suppressor-like RCC1 family protein